MGEDLSPAGAVLQWPLRHDILLLPVGAPWICRLGGHFAPLGNPFLLFISFYFNFRNDDLSNIQLGSLADQVSKSDKVWPFTNIFLIRTIRGCAKVSGCAARSLESDNHLFLSSQSDTSSIKPLAFSSYFFFFFFNRLFQTCATWTGANWRQNETWTSCSTLQGQQVWNLSACMLLFFMAHIWDIKITCKGLGVCFNPGKSAC